MPRTEYPKWVGDRLAHDAGEEDAARKAQGLSPADPFDPASYEDATPPGYAPLEYPKWVHGVIVMNEDEELARMADVEAVAKAAEPEPEPEPSDDRDKPSRRGR